MNRVRYQTLQLGIVAAFLASPVLSSRLHPNAYEGGRSRDTVERAHRNASSW